MIRRRPELLAAVSVLTLSVLSFAAWGLVARPRPSSARSALAVPALAADHAAGRGNPGQQPRKKTTEIAPLAESERSYLWDVEHLGNVLVEAGFKDLASALSRSDRPAIIGMLAPEFRGSEDRHCREVAHRSEWGSVVRRHYDSSTPLGLDRGAWVDRLLEFSRRFSARPHVKFSLMGLTPSARNDVDRPWDLSCLLRMWGEYGPSQPLEITSHLHFRVARPDKAGYSGGGWLLSSAVVETLVAEANRPLMREAAAARGINVAALHDNWRDQGRMTVTGGVYLCDYDRDGLVDMLVTDVLRYWIYRSTGSGSFVDVTGDLGLLSAPSIATHMMQPGRVAAFADLDGDGWEDLILSRQLYRNEEGRRFRRVTHLSNLELPQEAIGLAISDYDRDGRLDLYVTMAGAAKAESWLTGQGGPGTSNLLLRNLGAWQFEDVTDRSGAWGGGRSAFTALWFDANDDGWPDLYVPNEFGNGALLVNHGDGRFAEVSLGDGPGDFGTMGATCGDVDNDGRIDLYVGNMYSKAGNRIIGNLRPGLYPESVMEMMRSYSRGSQLHRNLGGLRFEPKGGDWKLADVGWAYGPALFDLDNDGWLDLYATCGYMSQDRSKPDG
jgi:hypothetical protein